MIAQAVCFGLPVAMSAKKKKKAMLVAATHFGELRVSDQRLGGGVWGIKGVAGASAKQIIAPTNPPRRVTASSNSVNSQAE